MLTAFVMDMSDNNNKNTEVSKFNTNEPGWVNIDLEPRNVDPEPHRAEATVIDPCPGWIKYDVEAQTPPKKRGFRYGLKSKIVVGIALVTMAVVGVTVPMVVSINNARRNEIQ